MKTLFFTLVLLPIGIALMLPEVGYGKGKTDPVEGEVQRLTLDIPSLYLINGLFLSADQNKQLAGILKESAKIHKQNQQSIQSFITGHKQETDLLLEQMIYGKKDSLSPAIKGKVRPNMQLHKVRGDWNNLINRGRGELDELARRTCDLLTSAQRDILDRFVPCFIPPGDFRNPERVGQADGDTSLAETMLSRLRKASPEKLGDAIERSLDGLVPYIMKEKHVDLTKNEMDELRNELRPSLKELTGRVRAMNDSDFELEKSKLVKEFLCLQEAAESKQPNRDNELGKIKLYILNPGIASIISRRAGDPGADFQADLTPASTLEEVKQKNLIFRTASLINSLQLTAGQAKQIMPCVQKAVTAREEIAIEAAIIQPKALQAYQALKNELENQQTSPQTEKDAGQYHHELKMLVMDKLAKILLQCESEIDKILSADQVALLSKRSDGRKGGGFRQNEASQQNISNTRSRARQVFEVLDNTNDKEFNSRVHEFSVRFIEDCISSGMVEPEAIDRNAETERVQQVLLRAKKMRNTEYQKNREDLIAEICPRRNIPRETKYGWQKSRGDQLEVVNPNSDLIFSQTGLTLLEKKIQVGN